tara:strand:- start:5302 stop:7365 length:2064 start_codon:yes stop_codon:yes gene_type:complete
MAEPRRPIGNLPGQGETSISSARPIDAYVGAPPIPKNTAVDQLANAFGNLGKAGAKASAQAEAKREKEKIALDTVKAQGHASRMVAESENGVITAIQLKEHYADLSDAIIAKIVAGENSSSFYSMAKERLSTLGDDIIMDKNALEGIYNELEQSALKATTDDAGNSFEFAQGGALDGVNRAIKEMSVTHAIKRDGITRDREGKVIAGKIVNLLDLAGEFSNEKTLQLVTEGITAIDSEVSSFDKTGRKGLIVDALIEYDINNPDKEPIAEKIIEAMPFLKGELTSAKLSENRGKIDSARFQKWNQNKIVKAEAERQEVEAGKNQINQKLINGEDINLADYKDNPELFDYAERKQFTSTLDPQQSSTDAQNLADKINSAYESGDFTWMGMEAGQTPSMAQLRTYIDGQSIRPEHAELVKAGLEDAEKGFSILRDKDTQDFFGANIGKRVSNFMRTKIDAGLLKFENNLDLELEVTQTFNREFSRLYRRWQKENPGQELPTAQKDEFLDRANAVAREEFNELVNLAVPSGQTPQAQEFETNRTYKLGDNTYGVFLGGDPNNNDNFRILDPEDPLDADRIDGFIKAGEEAKAKADADLAESNRVASLPLNRDEQLDVGSQSINLNENQIAEINKLLEGRDMNEDLVQEIIAQVLGVQDDSSFRFGGIDSADKTGEVAIEKLVEQFMSANN